MPQSVPLWLRRAAPRGAPRSRRIHLCLAGAAILLAACDDATTPTAATAPVGPAKWMVVPLDNEMDHTDSYVYSDLTVESTTTISSSQPFPHPDTEVPVTSLTLETPARESAVELGYDAYGQTRTSTYFAPDDDPNATAEEQVGVVRTIGDAQYTYDGNGALHLSTGDDPRMAEMLGTLQDAPITNGMVVDTEVELVQTVQNQLPGMPSLSRDAAGTPRIERLAPGRIRVTVEGAGDAPLGGAVLDRSTAPGRQRVSRTFGKKGNVWVLEEIRTENEREEAPGRRSAQTQVVRFKNVRWHKDKTRDDARRERRARRSAGGAVAVIVPGEGCEGRDFYTVDDPCYGGGDGGGGGGGTDPTGPGPNPTNCSITSAVNQHRRQSTPTGTNILVQHGFMDCANSYAYGRVGAALYDNFYADNVVYPTLDWSARYQDQADDLVGKMQAAAPRTGNFVMVGYSNGGLVSRRVGQMRPDLVRGVVTVSTPHRGVPVMRIARPAFEALFRATGFGLGASCAVRYHSGCKARDRFADRLGRPSPFGVDDLVPVTAEMVPGSAFQNALNSQPEGFTRVSIEQHASTRWVWGRVVADLGCDGPELPCGGRQAVKDIGTAHNVLVAATVVGGILGFFVPGAHAGAAVAAAGVMALNAIDGLYDWYTSPGPDGSDGVVPNASQRYPGAPVREVINGADSHDAAKKSDKAIDRLGIVLRRDFRADPPGSGLPGNRAARRFRAGR
ncbi:MAG TPA: alpha/beta hydrolase [Longimicrobium sp.]|nr:alpha/beta hydrolase [Longimicrobium sp.]